MRSIETIAWLTLAFASLVQSAYAADDLQSSQLVDQARRWQQKNRDDLAADLWHKLLIVDPKHPEALVKLGVIEVGAGNIAEAEALHNRAAQLTPRPAGLKELSTALDAAKDGPKKLQPQAAPQAQPKLAGSVAKVAQVKPAASLPVNAVATLPRPRASAKSVTTAAGATRARPSTPSPPANEAPQLIFSDSLDLVPAKPGP